MVEPRGGKVVGEGKGVAGRESVSYMSHMSVCHQQMDLKSANNITGMRYFDYSGIHHICYNTHHSIASNFINLWLHVTK